MKTLWTIALAPAATALLLLQGGQSQPRKLEPVPAPTAPTAPHEHDDASPAPPGGNLDLRAIEKQLRSDSLAEREAAYDKLLGAARRDAATRRALEEMAAGGGDLELAWTAKLALRELALRRDPFAGVRDPFDDLRQGDPFDLRLGVPFGRAFPDVGRFFEDMQAELDRLLQGQGMQPFAPGPGQRSQSQSFELESGPDGVKVRVRELVDGKEETKTYEAESMEQLLETYPELRDRIRVAPGLGGDTRRSLEDMLGRLRRSPFGGSDWSDRFPSFDFGRRAEVPTDRLGVMMREPGNYDPPAGVEPGLGLLVERALPGTIAAELGLQQGDLLLELNGKKLASGADVRSVLEARKPSDPLVLKILDALGQRRTLSWSPSDAGAPKQPEPLRRF